MSKIKVDTIEGSTGTTITVPTGQTLTLTDGLAATNLTGTIADARLPTVPVSKGGTGLTSLGSAGQSIKVNSGGNALEFGTVAGAIGNVQQVHYKGTTSYSGSGRGNSDVVTPLNMTFSRDSQTSKTLLRYNITMGTTGDCWVSMKIQYSTDNSSFSDVPDIADSFSSNTSMPRGHSGSAYRGGGNSGWVDYSQWIFPIEYLHDTSSISSSTIYYRIIVFKGHGSSSKTIYINRTVDMASTGDPNRNCGTSQLTVMEVL